MKRQHQQKTERRIRESELQPPADAGDIDTMSTFQNTITKYYATRVKYASAFAPPASTTTPAATSPIPTG